MWRTNGKEWSNPVWDVRRIFLWRSRRNFTRVFSASGNSFSEEKLR